VTESTELKHHGVKGMHWGVHKATGEAIQAHSSYSAYHQRKDLSRFGKRGARRINNRLHAGASLEQARKMERRRESKQRLAIAGGLVAAHVVNKYGAVAHQQIAIKAHNNRLQAEHDEKINYNKPRSSSKDKKSGVYTVTGKKK
jgi:hypothetical protein